MQTVGWKYEVVEERGADCSESRAADAPTFHYCGPGKRRAVGRER